MTCPASPVVWAIIYSREEGALITLAVPDISIYNLKLKHQHQSLFITTVSLHHIPSPLKKAKCIAIVCNIQNNHVQQHKTLFMP